jgi:ABC-type Fe3+/spermidine/putrescine transport system ATPase subunit
MTTGAAVSLRGVVHRRGRREVLRVDALDVSPGQRLVLLGPNGAGKTTLLRLIAALESPSDGDVRIDGVSTSEGGAALRRRVAYAPQRPLLLTGSVGANVELPLRYRRIPRADRRAAVASVLARLGIERLANRPAATLSGGEAQRTNLARALVTEPELLLLDEPAAALDTKARAEFFADVNATLVERATTAVLVTHRADEALALADAIAVLAEGELRQTGTPTALLAHPADDDVARLVGFDNVLHAHVTEDGIVRVRGQAIGLATAGHPGPVTLAAWGAAVRLDNGGEGALTARVRRCAPGPGRWELDLDAGTPLRAHLPLTAQPRRPGDTVAITLDHAQTVVIGSGRSPVLIAAELSAGHGPRP